MTLRQPLVAANWKMNGTLAGNRQLVQYIITGLPADHAAEVAICAPYIYLPDLSQQLQGSAIAWGAQNLSEHEAGAYTGEISATMLRDFHCSYVIVGHSERRNSYHEADQTVAGKFIRAISGELKPILCVGELLQERESGITEEVIARQLDAVISKSGIESFKQAVIAYEPVWAIGTGHTATPEQAQEVHAFIRLRLARHDDAIADTIRIIYGGSVNAGNAVDLFSMADVDGGLIGGASLVAGDFLTICQAAR